MTEHSVSHDKLPASPGSLPAEWETVTVMYHGSNLQVQQSHQLQLWTHLKGSIAGYNAIYDGIFGTEKESAPRGVFFSVTLVDSRLPSKSQYPTRAQKYEPYFRFLIRLDYLKLHEPDWLMFHVKTTPTDQGVKQQLVCFVKRRSPAGIWCMEHYANRHLNLIMNKAENDVLRYVGDAWYAKKYEPGKWWTNILILEDQIPLPSYVDTITKR